MNTHRALAVGAILAATLIPSARAATSTVIERGTQFVPKQVTVAPGDTVVWTFESGPEPGHTVTFDDGTDLNRNCPPSLLLNDCQDTPGEIVQRRFTAPGTYSYRCKIHSGMTGVVVVARPASTTVTTEPVSTSTTTQKPTSTTAKPTSSTTTTTRPLATSSTQVPSSTTTTTSGSTSVLLPGDPPPLTDETSAAANNSGREDETDSATVALIVALLLGVSAGGGLLLWRLRPGRP